VTVQHVDWHHINHLHATMQRCVSVALRVLLWQVHWHLVALSKWHFCVPSMAASLHVGGEENKGKEEL